jgi:hypothetical protein
MNDDPRIEPLAKLIAKEISYDASQDVAELKCPHCQKVAREAEYHHWIDHRGVLEGQIRKHLGVRDSGGEISRILEQAYVSGKRAEDAKNLATEIIAAVFC